MQKMRSRIVSVCFVMVVALATGSLGWTQTTALPTTWDVNGNGYNGLLVLSTLNAATNDVSGTLLGTPVRGYLVGRHLVLHRFPQGSTQIWDGWILDPQLGARGQPYYDGTPIIAGWISEDKGTVDGVYPWYAVAQSPAAAPSPSRVDLAGEWEMTCVGDIVYEFRLRLSQSGNEFSGDMTRTNGSEAHTTVSGRVLADGTLEFMRRTGAWKQHYLGKVVQQTGGRAIRIEGLFGDEGNEQAKWHARRTK